jgi:hypothetical protein
LDIEHSTTLDTLTTKLAALSGEDDFESYPTPADNSYFAANSYGGRKTPGSAGSIASIARRIESRIDDLYESRSGSGGRSAWEWIERQQHNTCHHEDEGMCFIPYLE